MKKYSIIDIETTGGSKKGNKITEIAIINMDGDQVVEEYSTLINPEKKIPINITYLTGISNQMVQDAPKFYQVAKKIVQMTEGRIFVAHNVFFDFNFIKNEFAQLGFQFRREKLCTVRLARKYLPGYKSYSLGNLCKDLCIEIENRHRALGDAKATSILFSKIISKIKDTDFIESESKKILLPPHLDRSEFEQLPNLIGVYYFYNDKDELLYVGKSKDIKKRAAQHFRPDIKRKKDILLKNSISKIRHKVFNHELIALLYECNEIKNKWPPFNISLKSRKFTYGVKLIENELGVLTPKLCSNIDPDHFIYQFKSKFTAQRKIDATYRTILGDISNLDSVENKIQQNVKILGTKQYNKMIDKAFHFNLPKSENFDLIFDAMGLKSVIEVIDKVPQKIKIYKKYQLIESIELKNDPQLKGIFWGYLHKHKLTEHIKVNELKMDNDFYE